MTGREFCRFIRRWRVVVGLLVALLGIGFTILAVLAPDVAQAIGQFYIGTVLLMYLIVGVITRE